MIVILFIASHVWAFHVPWWMWIIAALDGLIGINNSVGCKS